MSPADGEPPKPALVALRDRREEVIQILTDSFANDLLDVDMYEERTARAHAAVAVAELDALVADVAPLPEGGKRAPLARLQADPSLASGRPARAGVTAVFSSVERRGSWVVPGALDALTVFGSAVLDFRDARFSAGVTELRVRAVFGSLEIIVPPQLAVECAGSAVFGSFEDHGSGVADPDRAILRIHGSAVFGSVEVSTRLPGESERDARRRRRRERRALADARRRALPPHDPHGT